MLFIVAMVVQSMLNFWLMLNNVSPFSTLYCANESAVGVSVALVSLAPKTFGAVLLMTLPLLFENKSRTALPVKIMAVTRQKIEPNFKIWFWE